MQCLIRLFVGPGGHIYGGTYTKQKIMLSN